MNKKILSLMLISILIVTSMSGCIKVVKIGEEGKLTGESEFNAGDNVAEFWEAEALPELKDEAVDLSEFLKEAAGDLNSLADKYGTYSMGDSGELSYTVKGTATVEAVDTQSKAGTMVLKLDGYDGSEEVKIQIGTVIKGSSVRDSLSFIKFGDYTNQQDYAAVSQSINDIILQDVINPEKAEEMVGKDIGFLGCFTVNDNGTVLITPVELEVN
ncbi:putative lipoprotein [Lachnospiraceae bacterium PF1-21]